MNLSLLLKALGVKITREQVAAIEAMIPQIPGKIQEVIGIINNSLQNFDSRLKILEQQIELLRVEVRIYGSRDDSDDDGVTKPAGIGATQRTLLDERIGAD